MYDALELRINAEANVRPTNYAISFRSSLAVNHEHQSEVELECKITRTTVRKLTGLLPLFITIGAKPFTKMELVVDVPTTFRLQEEVDAMYNTQYDLSSSHLSISVVDDVVTLYLEGTGHGLQLSRRAFTDSLVKLYEDVMGNNPTLTTSTMSALLSTPAKTTSGVERVGASGGSSGLIGNKDMALWNDGCCILAEYRSVASDTSGMFIGLKAKQYCRVNSSPIRTLVKDADGVWWMRAAGWFNTGHESRLVSQTLGFTWI